MSKRRCKIELRKDGYWSLCLEISRVEGICVSVVEWIRGNVKKGWYGINVLVECEGKSVILDREGEMLWF